MSTHLTIGQLAAAAAMPTTTVRYYERRGLLGAAGRTGAGNYRSYSKAELERLRFIRAAQTSGFTLKDVGTLLSLRDGVTAPCKEVQHLIQERLRDVAARLADLQRVERVLKASRRMCRQFERSGRCRVIDTLAAGGRRKQPSKC